MTSLDFILLSILAGFVLYGFATGLIHMAGSFVGLVVGVTLAGRWYEGFSSWVASAFSINPIAAKVVAFAVLLSFFNRLVGIGFSLVDRVVRIANLIPGIATINRLAGAAVGFVEGLLTIGVTLYFATKFDVSAAWRETLADSLLVPLFIGVAQIVVPLLPTAFKSAQVLRL